jgi:putative lipoprotein
VTRAGWSLFGPSQTYGPATVVMAMASVDGMCRPNQYNGFVFVRDRFVGTLSPEPTMARSDGALGRIYLNSATELSADFARYTSRDALCCPSQTSNVTYSISSGFRGVLKADDVNTNPVCREDQGGGIGTMDNVVAGTVTYRQRSALPTGAVLIVKIVDVSRADASGTVIAERRVPLDGKHVPVPFDLAYERNRIVERNTYAIQAEIRDGNRLLFITETRYPVITQGNPRNVEVTVVPVGGGGGGNRDTVVRGTVTYRQRIALENNSEVTVKLVDAATPDAAPVAETKVSTGNRQVPISFELPYESRDINRQREYILQAEIRSGGKLRFRSETGVPVTLRGNQDQNIEIVVVPASDEPEAITGRTLSLSGFGTGSMQIGTRSAELLIRSAVNVQTDGNASVTVSRPFGGSVTFSGKLTAFDTTSLRITVSSSGNADASGEIQVSYSGRNLRSISATDLKLDGQEVVLRF